MSPDKQAALYRDFPRVFAIAKLPAEKEGRYFMPIQFGIECGDGWEPLIRRMCEKLEPLDAEIYQIKEKFGGLRVGIGTTTDEISQIVDDAEEESWDVCEDCGEQGSPRPDLGWIRTLCAKHYDETTEP